MAGECGEGNGSGQLVELLIPHDLVTWGMFKASRLLPGV